MRIKLMFYVALILTGCTQTNSPTPLHQPDTDFAYDERDAIPSNAPLPKPGVNQRPVVGTKKVLVSVVHWQGEKILNKPLIEKHTLSTDPDSLRSYILAASHGKLTLTGQVIEYTSGPRPQRCITWEAGDPLPLPLSIEEGKKAASAQGINPDSFDYVINIIECGGSASAYAPGRTMGVYAQAGSPHVYKHEFGHNLGYHHGSTYIKCPKRDGTVLAPHEMDPIECAIAGYGDTGDSVSGGATLYPANNRWYSGWLDDSQAAVIGKTGLYRLGILGGSGPQLYLINRPGQTPSQLALEYRKPTSFDNFPPGDNRVNGVWVRYTAMGGSLLNTQLDATPETATTLDPTLRPGNILKDTGTRITVKVCNTFDDGAVLAVAVNGEALPICTPLLIPQPDIHTPPIAPQTTRNPIVFSGTGIPGANVSLSYNPNGTVDPERINVVADAKGNWQATLMPFPPGDYAIQATQFINFNVSTVLRKIKVVP